jgi:hypothetical protein
MAALQVTGRLWQDAREDLILASSPQANIGETPAQWPNGQAVGERPRQGTQSMATNQHRRSTGY